MVLLQTRKKTTAGWEEERERNNLHIMQKRKDIRGWFDNFERRKRQKKKTTNGWEEEHNNLHIPQKRKKITAGSTALKEERKQQHGFTADEKENYRWIRGRI